MFIFVRMQNCVKRLVDSCFPVQNRQKTVYYYGTLAGKEAEEMQDIRYRISDSRAPQGRVLPPGPLL